MDFDHAFIGHFHKGNVTAVSLQGRTDAVFDDLLYTVFHFLFLLSVHIVFFFILVNKNLFLEPNRIWLDLRLTGPFPRESRS